MVGVFMVNKLQALAVAAALAGICGAAHAETRLSFSVGADYSTGEYGNEDETDVIAAPFSIRLTAGGWSVRASSAYLWVDGPADIAESDGSGDGSGGTIVREGKVQGIGDTTLAVEYTFREIGGSPAYVELGARARLPTGDEDKGLGVGATDYIGTTEIGVSGEDGGIYLSGGYRWLGDNDVDDRQDGAQAGVGAWISTGSRTRVGAFANWREASIEGDEDPATAGVYFSYRALDDLRISVTATAGLSDASADYGTGIRFTWRPDALSW
jgi:hypothetical protein